MVGEVAECKCSIFLEKIIKEASEEPIEVVEFPCDRDVYHHYIHLECFNLYHETNFEKGNVALKCPICRIEYDMP